MRHAIALRDGTLSKATQRVRDAEERADNAENRNVEMEDQLSKALAMLESFAGHMAEGDTQDQSEPLKGEEQIKDAAQLMADHLLENYKARLGGVENRAVEAERNLERLQNRDQVSRGAHAAIYNAEERARAAEKQVRILQRKLGAMEQDFESQCKIVGQKIAEQSLEDAKLREKANKSKSLELFFNSGSKELMIQQYFLNWVQITHKGLMQKMMEEKSEHQLLLDPIYRGRQMRHNHFPFLQVAVLKLVATQRTAIEQFIFGWWARIVYEHFLGKRIDRRVTRMSEALKYEMRFRQRHHHHVAGMVSLSIQRLSWHQTLFRSIKAWYKVSKIENLNNELHRLRYELHEKYDIQRAKETLHNDKIKDKLAQTCFLVHIQQLVNGLFHTWVMFRKQQQWSRLHRDLDKKAEFLTQKKEEQIADVRDELEAKINAQRDEVLIKWSHQFAKEFKKAIMQDFFSAWAMAIHRIRAKQHRKIMSGIADEVAIRIEEEKNKMQQSEQQKAAQRAEIQAEQAYRNKIRNLILETFSLWAVWYIDCRNSRREKALHAELMKATKEAEAEMERMRGDFLAKGMEQAFNLAEEKYAAYIRGWVQVAVHFWGDHVKALRAQEKDAAHRAEVRRIAEEAEKAMTAEVDKLKQERMQHADEQAQRMAEQCHKKHCVSILQEVLTTWIDFFKTSKFEKEQRQREAQRAQEQRELEQKMHAELESLKNSHREAGDANAQRMAEQFYKKHCMHLQESVLGHWIKIYQTDKMQKLAMSHRAEQERHKAEAEEKMAKELEALKNSRQAAAEQQAEVMAEKFHRKYLMKILQEVLLEWIGLFKEMKTEKEREAHAKERAELEKQASQSKTALEAELENLKTQHREAGDAKAEQMANAHYKKHMKGVMQNYFNFWKDEWQYRKQEKQTVTLQNQIKKQQEAAEKAAEEAKQKMEQELEALKSAKREAGDAQAQRMAETFRKQRLEILLRTVMGSWGTFRMEEKKRKAEAAHKQQLDTLAAQHEEHKAKVDADIEELKNSHRKAGDEKAEKLADQWRKKHLLELCATMYGEWKEVLRQQRMARKLAEEESKKREAEEKARAELEELKRSHAEAGEKKAELLADKFIEKANLALRTLCFGGWEEIHKHAVVAKREREFQLAQKEAQMKAEAEMEALRSAHRQAGDAKAEQMAEKFRQKHLNHLQLELMTVWKDVWKKGVEERKAIAAKQKEEALAEQNRLNMQKAEEQLEAMKHAHREAGGAQAEKMAKKFYKKHLIALRDDTFMMWKEGWKQAIDARTAEAMAQQNKELMKKHEKELAKAAQEAQEKAEAELAALKYESRQAGDAQAEKMADQFFKKHMSRKRNTAFSEWREYYQALRQKRREAELLEQQRKAQQDAEAELEALRNAHRKAGDDKAEDIAEKYRKKTAITLRLHAWNLWKGLYKDAQAEKKMAAKEAEMAEKFRLEQAKKDAELEAMKNTHREAGDKKAAQMAVRFQEKRILALRKHLFKDWNQIVHKTKVKKAEAANSEYFEEIKRKQEAELEKMLAQQRQAGDAKAEMIAERYRQKHNMKSMLLCYGEWKHQFKDTQMARLEEEKRKRELELEAEKAQIQLRTRQELEDELEALKHAHREAGDANSKRLAEQLVKKRLVRKQTQCFYAWMKGFHETKQEQIVKKHEAEKDEQQRKMEAELEFLQEQERKAGDANAKKMAEVFRKKEMHRLKMSIFNLWSFNHRKTQSAKKEAELVKAQAEERKKLESKFELEIEELKKKDRKPGDAVAQKIAQRFKEARGIELVAVCFKSLMYEYQLSVVSKKQAQQAQTRAELKAEVREQTVQIKAQGSKRNAGDVDAVRMASSFANKMFAVKMADIFSAWAMCRQQSKFQVLQTSIYGKEKKAKAGDKSGKDDSSSQEGKRRRPKSAGPTWDGDEDEDASVSSRGSDDFPHNALVGLSTAPLIARMRMRTPSNLILPRITDFAELFAKRVSECCGAQHTAIRILRVRADLDEEGKGCTMVDFGVLAAPGGPDAAFNAITQALNNPVSTLLHDPNGRVYFSGAVMQRTTLAATAPVTMPPMPPKQTWTQPPGVPAWARSQEEILRASAVPPKSPWLQSMDPLSKPVDPMQALKQLEALVTEPVRTPPPRTVSGETMPLLGRPAPPPTYSPSAGSMGFRSQQAWSSPNPEFLRSADMAFASMTDPASSSFAAMGQAQPWVTGYSSQMDPRFKRPPMRSYTMESKAQLQTSLEEMQKRVEDFASHHPEGITLPRTTVPPGPANVVPPTSATSMPQSQTGPHQ
eukprot:gnl/MRDRNA2_/MRDRNA2_103024_c0_seq1.p1 gnl/MRDRNA2_/MRDRNA2_103024_c0~~gnl/MRDRNA2_/MRDRNA2_103024_c0_seq1.p1  ORF type:complete len:2448 (-),score=692.26 gnl/MRDRNA2_/MRDRNA2_103024_c0_seq1:45-6860(-)